MTAGEYLKGIEAKKKQEIINMVKEKGVIDISDLNTDNIPLHELLVVIRDRL